MVCVCVQVCVCVHVCVHVYCLRVCFSFIQHPGDNVRIINTARNVSELRQLVSLVQTHTALGHSKLDSSFPSPPAC